jgi:predicted amidohydrolase YtcJ
MAGIAAFEAHHDPAQRLLRDEAIRAYTVGSARLAHQEDKKGSLAPGTHADFAAYDVDPVAVESVAGARPVLTVSLGRDVYAA